MRKSHQPGSGSQVCCALSWRCWGRAGRPESPVVHPMLLAMLGPPPHLTGGETEAEGGSDLLELAQLFRGRVETKPKGSHPQADTL